MSAIIQISLKGCPEINLPSAGEGRAIRSFLDWPIALMGVAWFFNLPYYVGMFLIPAVTPVACGAVTVALIGGRQLLARDYIRQVDPSLPVWLLGLGLLDLCWFAMFGGGDTSIIGSRLLFLVLMLGFYLVFSTVPNIWHLVTRMLFIGSWIIVPVLAYDVAHPFTFVPQGSEFAEIGRAAAIFVNPNSAAAALCAALLLNFWHLRGAWRWTFLAWISCGILLTGSRGAIVSLPIVFVLMALLGRMSGQVFLKSLLVVCTLASCAWLALPYVADYIGIQPTYVTDRFIALMDSSQGADFSSNEREYLAGKGIDKYLTSPVVGSGVGSTELWVERTSTHNMFIQLLSDFGVIGGLVLPVLLWMGVVSPGPTSRASITTFYVMWAFFSHNILNTETALMIAVALVFSRGSDSHCTNGAQVGPT